MGTTPPAVNHRYQHLYQPTQYHTMIQHMLNTFVVLSFVSAAAVARPQSNQYAAPPPPQSSYEQPQQSYEPQGAAQQPQPSYNQGPGMPYSFEWAVQDEYSNNDYSHQQSSDGDVTNGVYRTLLPDGRVQIVTFSDNGNGYEAQVEYEGEAQYPDSSQNKNSYAPAPNSYAPPQSNSYS